MRAGALISSTPRPWGIELDADDIALGELMNDLLEILAAIHHGLSK